MVSRTYVASPSSPAAAAVMMEPALAGGACASGRAAAQDATAQLTRVCDAFKAGGVGGGHQIFEARRGMPQLGRSQANGDDACAATSSDGWQVRQQPSWRALPRLRVPDAP